MLPKDQNPVSIAGEQENYLWLGTGTGIVRLHCSEFEKAARDAHVSRCLQALR